jgi:GTP-sensing pleiotropic transcriptional regulator CodY
MELILSRRRHIFSATEQLLAHFGTRTYGADMSEKKLETAAEHYRAKAAAMLKLAEDAATEEARKLFLQLATNWNSLAETLENPSW